MTNLRFAEFLAATPGGIGVETAMRTFGTEEREATIAWLIEQRRQDVLVFQEGTGQIGRITTADTRAFLVARGVSPDDEITV